MLIFQKENGGHALSIMGETKPLHRGRLSCSSTSASDDEQREQRKDGGKGDSDDQDDRPVCKDDCHSEDLDGNMHHPAPDMVADLI